MIRCGSNFLALVVLGICAFTSREANAADKSFEYIAGNIVGHAVACERLGGYRYKNLSRVKALFKGDPEYQRGYRDQHPDSGDYISDGKECRENVEYLEIILQRISPVPENSRSSSESVSGQSEKSLCIYVLSANLAVTGRKVDGQPDIEPIDSDMSTKSFSSALDEAASDITNALSLSSTDPARNLAIQAALDYHSLIMNIKPSELAEAFSKRQSGKSSPAKVLMSDAGSAYAKYVTEAKRRGYTPASCAKALGRTATVAKSTSSQPSTSDQSFKRKMCESSKDSSKVQASFMQSLSAEELTKFLEAGQDCSIF
tara:strand:+ start:270 stop:1214 length:945 start_codon:yes stop_codon:yes gene_type:complete